ncbi:MAG: carboxymuconolactone decarboxylase family protein [Labilithrix sp.]|nr:carboxymuconolactone decarboxylase family protein [Labilithrix sp.]
MSPAARARARIAPGAPGDIGVVNALVTRAIGLATGGRAPNVFTTLARHRRLFRRWLVFAAGLMPGGTLARTETELVILHVARRMACEYEWRHHVRLGRRAGLTVEAIERVRRDEIDAELFSARERALLRASHELQAHREIGDATWDELRAHATEPEIIELCLLVGHYQMLAMTLNTLRVPLDEP